MEHDELTVAQAAAELGITPATLRARLQRGVMQGRSLAGRVWLIPRAEVERWRPRGHLRPGRHPRPAAAPSSSASSAAARRRAASPRRS
jgi:excisionase family DNA binding protein